MVLQKYKKDLFGELSSGINIEYDSETLQYCIINDATPGIFGLGDTKQQAIAEYLSALGDMILVNEQKKDETVTYS